MLPGHSQAWAGDSVKLQLKWHHQFQFAGYYAAQAQGYYREKGLEVTFIPGDAQHSPIQEVLAGHANFGVSDSGVLKAYLEGKPLVVLGAIFQHSPYILITRADSGIRTPSDLRGKAVMLSHEHDIAQLKAMFRREGMSLDAIRIIPHQWNTQMLIDGQVDAISAYLTVEPFQLKSKGIKPGIIRAMDYGVDFYGDTLFTTKEEVDRHPARVAAFRQASLRGWEYAMNHPEEIIDLILKMPGVQERGVTRELLRHEAEAMRELILPDLVSIGHMNPGRWETIGRTYADIGFLARAPSAREIERFIYDPSPASRNEWLMPLLISLGVLGLVALWVLVWNAQLRRAVATRTSALQRAEQQLRYHVENSPLAVVEWDSQYRVTRWTGQAEQVFGWKAEEVLGRHPNDWNFVFEQDRPVVDRLIGELVRGEQLRSMNANRNYRKDGTLIECEWYNSAQVDGDGKVISMLSVALDVTDRKRAQAALQAVAEQRRIALEAGKLGAWEYRFDNGEVFWDEACRNMFGVKAGTGLSYEEVFKQICPQDRAAVDKAVKRALSGEDGGIYHQEFRVVWPDGSSHWISSHGRVHFEGEGDKRRAIRFVGVNTEVTERKQAEQILTRSKEDLERLVQERTAKLQETIVELEQFSYALTHDMRAPLRGMNTYATVLEEEAGAALPTVGQEYLRRIKTSASRMDQLIQDALNYSKVVRGEIPVHPIDLGKLLRSILETYPNLQEPGAEIRIDFKELLVMGNESALTQTFSNLLGNAVKFVAPGVKPRVRVWAEERKPSPTSTPDLASSLARRNVLVWVEDNGIGIPKEAHEKIFGMFQRMHRVEEFPGTGIGLAIVRKSLSRIGGQICLDSEPGKGSRFCVQLVKGNTL